MRPFFIRLSFYAIRHAVGVLTILSCALWFWVACTHAQSITDRLTNSPNIPWQINADTVDYDAQSTTYHARGNVIIEKQTTRLIADAVSFNHKAMTATAVGHVVMTVGDDVLSGDRLELNLDQETGVVHNGSIFFKENHFHIRGARIEKTGKEAYQAERAAITSCDGERPDWVITGRSVKLTIEGYGSATHAVFRARDIPVLYSPYIWFPTKTKRQSGLLIPEAGLSDRKGFSWDQPLFWAINDSSDATLYPHFMAERGTKMGLEYRYAASDNSYGAIMADGLNDRRVDDGTPEATRKWGYAGDAYTRPNTDRYWLRAKQDQQLPWGAQARLDLDIVSDQDYLSEFRDGQSGFYATRDYFLDRFGRDLDTYDETIRTNRLNISRIWSRYTLNGDLLWNDNVTNRRWEETDGTLQQLPVIQFNSAKQQALDSPVFWDVDSEYTYFYRQDGERGHRTDIFPRAYLPLRWENYLSVEPSAGWRQTAWIMDRREDDTLDRTTYRQIYDARLDLSTRISKVMDSPVAAADRIRHSIKPRVVYEYIPDQDQSDLPDFGTDTDRIVGANQVTYSLTNIFTTRTAKKNQTTGSTGTPAFASEGGMLTDIRPRGRPAATDDAATDRNLPERPTPQIYDYSRICRLYLEQTYDIAAARDNDPEPFSDLFGELDVNFGRYFGLDSDASFDTYESRFVSHNLAAGIRDPRGDQLRVEHRYQKNVNESIRSTLFVKLTDRLGVLGEYERNLLDEEDIVKGVGLVYITQCWSVDINYAVEGEDNKFSLFINLMGLGGLGK